MNECARIQGRIKTFEQCDVGGWRNITQVGAGAEHTVGFEVGGSVVAVGAGDWRGRDSDL